MGDCEHDEPGDKVDVGPMAGLHLEPPTSASAIRANARAVLPLVAAEAEAVEQSAGLTPVLADAMRRAGLFQMAFPRRLGGLQMGIADQVELVALLSSVDASAGWHVGVLNATGYYASRLGERAYAELYPTFDMPTAGSFHPRGTAVQVTDGFMVSGHWDWGSGAGSAEHVIGGCLVVDERGSPVLGANGRQMHLGLWLPRTAIQSADNWQTVGLRGSGSASFSITTPVFVPADHSFDREADIGVEIDPLNATPTIAHYALGGVVLGLARHAVNLAAAAVRDKAGATGASSVDNATKQALGEVIGEVDVAYGGVREIARMTDEIIFGGGQLTALHEARMTAANAISAMVLRRVLHVCMELVSSHFIFDRHPMQRVIRDSIGALAHSGTRRTHLAALGDAALRESRNGPVMADDPLDWQRYLSAAAP